MIQRVCGGIGLLLFAPIVFAAQDVVSAVEGTVNIRPVVVRAIVEACSLGVAVLGRPG